MKIGAHLADRGWTVQELNAVGYEVIPTDGSRANYRLGHSEDGR